MEGGRLGDGGGQEPSAPWDPPILHSTQDHCTMRLLRPSLLLPLLPLLLQVEVQVGGSTIPRPSLHLRLANHTATITCSPAAPWTSITQEARVLAGVTSLTLLHCPPPSGPLATFLTPPTTTLTHLTISHTLGGLLDRTVMKNLTNLEHLEVTRSNLSSTTDVLGDLQHLKTVSLTSCGLEELPLRMFDSTRLTAIDLRVSGQSLRSPESLRQPAGEAAQDSQVLHPQLPAQPQRVQQPAHLRSRRPPQRGQAPG